MFGWNDGSLDPHSLRRAFSAAQPRRGFGMRIGLGALLGTLVIAAAAGCSSTVTEVEMSGLRFEPRVIEVPSGTTVTWRFTDGLPHNITSDLFSSDDQRAGTFTHTFQQPGTYRYSCTLHPGMDGRVVVN
jgi:plastocyanin